MEEMIPGVPRCPYQQEFHPFPQQNLDKSVPSTEVFTDNLEYFNDETCITLACWAIYISLKKGLDDLKILYSSSYRSFFLNSKSWVEQHHVRYFLFHVNVN